MNTTSQVRVLKWLKREGRYSAPLVIVSVCVLSYVQVCNPVDCIASQAPLKIPWDFPGKKTGAGCHFLLGKYKLKPLHTYQIKKTDSDRLDEDVEQLKLIIAGRSEQMCTVY